MTQQPGVTVPPPNPTGLTRSLERNIEAMARRRRDEDAAATREERVASAITGFTGSMPFIYLHLVAYSTWVLLNLGVVPRFAHFDPGFTILATEASVEAIFLSTFVLMGQNRSSRVASKRADLDLHVTLLTEHELTTLTQLVTAMAAKLGVSVEEDGELAEAVKDVAPEAVLDKLAQRPDEA